MRNVIHPSVLETAQLSLHSVPSELAACSPESMHAKLDPDPATDPISKGGCYRGRWSDSRHLAVDNENDVDGNLNVPLGVTRTLTNTDLVLYVPSQTKFCFDPQA